MNHTTTTTGGPSLNLFQCQLCRAQGNRNTGAAYESNWPADPTRLAGSGVIWVCNACVHVDLQQRGLESPFTYEQ